MPQELLLAAVLQQAARGERGGDQGDHAALLRPHRGGQVAAAGRGGAGQEGGVPPLVPRQHRGSHQYFAEK